MSSRRNRWKFGLPPHDGWTCLPGYKIFVAERGVLRLDFPRDWVVEHEPPDPALFFRDKPGPNDDIQLKMSLLKYPVPWQQLPLREILLQMRDEHDKDHTLWVSEVEEVVLPHHKYAWTESEWIPPDRGRNAIALAFLVAGPSAQAFFTLDFWASEQETVRPIWKNIRDSIQIGIRGVDPRRNVYN